MKCLVLVVAGLAIAVLPAFSQTSTPPGHDHVPRSAQHGEHMQSLCEQVTDEHVAEMKATSETLATNLAQMKATLPLINDLNERSRWQSNIAMWQALADHFSHMVHHAQHMQATGMGCGMMMGHGTDDGHDKATPPAEPQ